MLVRRDPFARLELHRKQVAPTRDGCGWCGTKNGKFYRFWRETDGGRSYQIPKTYCSNSCFRADNGE